MRRANGAPTRPGSVAGALSAAGCLAILAVAAAALPAGVAAQEAAAGPEPAARAAAGATLAAAAPRAIAPPETEHPGAVALGLELRRLGHTRRALMIAAHPDDEDTQLLAALALGVGADVAYVSLTRGEGGQNGIGPELQEALGLLRSEELLAARRLDGAVQFFTRAYDFGYSKSIEETLGRWRRDEVLADVVAAVRAFRPDVILTVFSGTPRDGHGHHQAAGRLAREAFEAAGDPTRFPDQIGFGLRAHSPAKLYRSSWFRAEEATIRIETGGLDPLIGRSHHQVAMASRSRHRSQDMGTLELPGPRSTHAQRLAAPADAPPADEERSIFDGIETRFSARAGALEGRVERDRLHGIVDALTAYEARAAAVREGFNPLEPERVVDALVHALEALDAAASLLPGTAEAEPLAFLVATEARAARRALALAAGVRLDAIAGTGRLVPGARSTLELSLWNGGPRPIRVERFEPALPPGWTAVPATQDAAAASGPELGPGELRVRRFEMHVPDDAAPSEPYYLRAPRSGEMYAWPRCEHGDSVPDTVCGRLGIPFERAALRATARVRVGGIALDLDRDADHRLLDRRQGELRRPVLVVPAVSVELEPGVRVLPVTAGLTDVTAGEPRANAAAIRSSAGPVGAGRPSATPHAAAAPPPLVAPTAGAQAAASPLTFGVRLRTAAPDGIAGTASLQVPPGWHVEPDARAVRFDGPGEEVRLEFAVTPPPAVRPADYRIAATFRAEDGRVFDRGYSIVEYPHVRPRPLFRDAVATVPAFDVRVPAGLRVGYVLGAADRVPAALRQLGLDVRLLEAAELAAGDLDRYDVIVVGPRAYEVRPDLAANHARLLEFARAGGTLVVQYNQYGFVQAGFPALPLEIARPHDRVTDSASPVRLLAPEHPALIWPNRIGPADFDGWVQERGLYFARDWDDRYTPILEMNDPGEPPVRGGLLVAPYGAGTYVYTGIAFFRQLPAGVPGAFRLFVNLLALGTR